MAYDATKPAVADNYSTGYTQNIRDNFDYLLKLGEGGSVTGTPPTNAKRYDPTSDLFQYWNGSAWATMPLAYVSSAGGSYGGTFNFGAVQRNGNNLWGPDNFDPATKANVAGQVFSAAISTSSGGMTAAGRVEGNGGAGNGLGKITVSTSQPSGGSQGDIWCVYT